MKDRSFALIDGNNFFVSCERIARPDLRNKPVVVLSNNDGVIIARSNEVKELGISMATPLYKVRKKLEDNDVKVFSSNYLLYADISRRVTALLREYFKDVQVYSIDESFVLMSENRKNIGAEVRDKVFDWIGVPVSVGIGSTKTLAKIANEISKKNKWLNNILDLNKLKESEIDQYLRDTPVIEVWGYGRKTYEKLAKYGVETAFDLKYSDEYALKSITNINVYRTILELRGISCYRLKNNKYPQKGIACTRSFGYRVSRKKELVEAVSSYTATAVEKLRSQGSVAQSIYVYINTNRHNKEEEYYFNGLKKRLVSPSFDTRKFTQIALEILDKIYKSGKKYKKAGVCLGDIRLRSDLQFSLFEGGFDKLQKNWDLMESVDKINREQGRGTIELASAGEKKSWQMKGQNLTKRFTTHWDELIEVV